MRHDVEELTLYSTKTSITVLLVLFVCAFCVSGDEKVYTEDGRTVLLKDDGTWEYVEEETQLDEYDFRKVTWGMSIDQVKGAEQDAPAAEQGGYIGYDTTISGLSCALMYYFTTGRLTRAVYLVTASHSNKNDYIRDFDNLKELLTKKYGVPSSDDSIWKKSLFKDDREEWGTAVSIGHLVYIAFWETERTDISIILSGDNYKITLAMLYTGKELADFQSQTEEAAALS